MYFLSITFEIILFLIQFLWNFYKIKFNALFNLFYKQNDNNKLSLNMRP